MESKISMCDCPAASGERARTNIAPEGLPMFTAAAAALRAAIPNRR